MTKVDQQIEEARTATANLAAAGLITPYQEALTTAAIVDGHELVDQEALLDVPFVITGVTYRNGVPTPDKRPTNYLSIEVLVGDAAAIQRRKDRGKLPPTWDVFDPQERLVFNDGSTGIARQVTSYLEQQEAIELPDGPGSGVGAGESRWDTYRGEWVSAVVEIVEREDGTLTDPHFAFGPDGVAPFLSCPRGLRRSDYRIDGFASDSTTFYAG